MEFLKNVWFGILLTIGFILIVSILFGLLYLIVTYIGQGYAFITLYLATGIILLHELGKNIRKDIDNNRE